MPFGYDKNIMISICLFNCSYHIGPLTFNLKCKGGTTTSVQENSFLINTFGQSQLVESKIYHKCHFGNHKLALGIFSCIEHENRQQG